MSPHERTTVLIAGGGPVGMLLAAELAHQRIDTIVIEQHPEPPDVPRAGTLHARSVQSLLRRGYLRTASPGSLTTHHTTGFHFGGQPVLEISAPTAEGVPVLNRPQQELERTFETRARALGADVRRGRRVERLRPRGDAVQVEVSGADGRYVVEAAYVVGCDGARSTVRDEAGIGSTTTPPTFGALIGRVRLLEPHGVPPGWTHGRDGWTLLNVNPHGHSRVITHDFRRPLPSRRAPAHLDELRRTTEHILGRPVPMDRPTYLSRFSDFTRLADTYRSGRILLAGDAAHVHAPLGGQGLNTGLQDAFNLGWKLALVARGDAPPALLDTYTRERRPVAATVIANTRTQASLMRPGPEYDPLRSRARELLRQPDAGREVADEISGQSVAYTRDAQSALEGRFLPNHRFRTDAGPRTTAELLTGGLPLLLLTPRADAALAEAAAGWSDRLLVVRADGEEPLGWDALVCRPDGYTAWAASASDAAPQALTAALTRWFGPARAATPAFAPLSAPAAP
jgi:2-polyprenyl-6-methoxyphenol hydroxylase-like FAD-dependent oxidoreductase